MLLLQANSVVSRILEPERLISAYPSLAKDLNIGFDPIPGEFLSAMHSVLPCLISVPEQVQDGCLRVYYSQSDLVGTSGGAAETYFNGVDCRDVTYGTENSQETCKQRGCSKRSDAVGPTKPMLWPLEAMHLA